jgi:hypothetical protein
MMKRLPRALAVVAVIGAASFAHAEASSTLEGCWNDIVVDSRGGSASGSVICFNSENSVTTQAVMGHFAISRSGTFFALANGIQFEFPGSVHAVPLWNLPWPSVPGKYTCQFRFTGKTKLSISRCTLDGLAEARSPFDKHYVRPLNLLKGGA